MYHDQRTVKAASSNASKWHNANNTGTRPTSTSERWFPAWKYSDLIIIINERASSAGVRRVPCIYLTQPPCAAIHCSVLSSHYHTDTDTHRQTQTDTDTHRHTQTHTDTHTHTHTHARTHARYFSGIWIVTYRRKAANLNRSEKQNQPKPQCWVCDKSGMVAYSSLKSMKSTGWSH